MFLIVLLFGCLFFGCLVVRDHWVCPHSIKCATAFETIPTGKTRQGNHFQANRWYVRLLGDLCLDCMVLFCGLGLFAVHISSTYYRVTNIHYGCVSQLHAHYHVWDKAFSISNLCDKMLYPPWFCPGNASPLALKRGGPGSVHKREPSTCSKCSRFRNFLQNVHTSCYTQSGSNLAGVTLLTYWQFWS